MIKKENLYVYVFVDETEWKFFNELILLPSLLFNTGFFRVHFTKEFIQSGLADSQPSSQTSLIFNAQFLLLKPLSLRPGIISTTPGGVFFIYIMEQKT